MGQILLIFKDFHRLATIWKVVVYWTGATCSTNSSSSVTMEVRWHLGIVEIQLLLDPGFLNPLTWLIISSTARICIHRQRRSHWTNGSNWINASIHVRCSGWWNNVVSCWLQWHSNNSFLRLTCPFNVSLNEIYCLVFLRHVWLIDIWGCNRASLVINSISSIHIVYSSLVWCWSLLWASILVYISQLCNRCWYQFLLLNICLQKVRIIHLFFNIYILFISFIPNTILVYRLTYRYHLGIINFTSKFVIFSVIVFVFGNPLRSISTMRHLSSSLVIGLLSTR